MSVLLVCLGRLFVILVGFLFASLGASAFLHLLLFGGTSWTGDEIALVAGGFLVSIPFVALFVGYYAFLPAMVVVVATELLGRRDWLFFALAGGVTGLAVAGFYLASRYKETQVDSTAFAMALAAAGMVGGLCYWLVAGRSAGLWLRGGPTLPERSES